MTTAARIDVVRQDADAVAGGSGQAFLRNAWYVAAWSSEIEYAPFARRLLDQPVLLWRSNDGVVALADSCPHRFAPLSRGELTGDVIECAYHGLRFDRAGQCVHNPHGPVIPPGAKVQSYPVVERHGLVWIWMGDSDACDPRAIPDFAFLEDAERPRGPLGYLVLEAHYQLAVDNLLDLTHTQFLHKSTLGSGSISDGEFTVWAEGDTVHAERYIAAAPAPPIFELRYPLDRRPVDHWLQTRWDVPGVMRQRTGVALAGEPRENGWESVGCHLLTPCTARSTHYFFTSLRDPRARTLPADDFPADGKPFVEANHPFVIEDGPMLAAQQARMGTTDLMSLHPVILPSDAAALRVRAIMRRRIAGETRPPGAAVQPGTEDSASPNCGSGAEPIASASS